MKLSSPLKNSVVLTGSSGQLSQSIIKLWSSHPISMTHTLLPFSKSQLDITDPKSIDLKLPSKDVAVLINTAAYTDVNGAEINHEISYEVNALGPELLSKWAHNHNAKLLQVSTDFVFDGNASVPYDIYATPNPINIYGLSKRKGEESVIKKLPESSSIVRTSALYSSTGKNFVNTMLNLMITRDSLSVIDDQIISPTSSNSLARVLMSIAQKLVEGTAHKIYHWNDGGTLSWYDFATEIQKEALSLGLLTTRIPIARVPSRDYESIAQRPSYSVMDRGKTLTNFECPKESWQTQLNTVLKKKIEKKSNLTAGL
jgi:dTDP-4-dehydrorhamnose reductase